jgi:2-dehydro-3-deoxyphosphogluconate aldolase/(4S)-4-hydroxy-2-oxoglutarate aldolase
MAKYARLEVLDQVIRQGLVPLTYTPDLETMKKLVTASYEGGCRLFEFTNRGDNAIWVFTDLMRYFQKEIPNLIMGAGSILDPGTASLYLSSGANFIVGSVFNPEIAKVCNRRKVAYMPGCATATEISTAEEYGVEIVKVFPGEAAGGPGFVKAILGPTPWTKVMITGGVEDNPENINAWFKAGVTAVGMGSNLFKKAWVKEGRYDQISQTVASVLKWIRQAGGEKTDYHLEHIGIYPTEQATAQEIAEWYARAFGLNLVEGNNSYMLEGASGGRIEVVKASGPDKIHLAISVSDFEDAVAELKSRGFEVEDSPRISPTLKSVFLKSADPAGYRVHILWRREI